MECHRIDVHWRCIFKLGDRENQFIWASASLWLEKTDLKMLVMTVDFRTHWQILHKRDSWILICTDIYSALPFLAPHDIINPYFCTVQVQFDWLILKMFTVISGCCLTNIQQIDNTRRSTKTVNSRGAGRDEGALWNSLWKLMAGDRFSHLLCAELEL